MYQLIVKTNNHSISLTSTSITKITLFGK